MLRKNLSSFYSNSFTVFSQNNFSNNLFCIDLLDIGINSFLVKLIIAFLNKFLK